MSARVPSLVSPAWLAARLPSVKVVDASWYLPAMGRDGKAEYAARRIPGARHWDLDATDDPSDLPHMLPSPGFFADSMAALGVTSDDHIVAYDGKGIFSAPRLWWMLRAAGHPAVAVLDGGWPAWRRGGGPVESGDAAGQEPPAIDVDHREVAWTPGSWIEQVATATEVEAIVREDAQAPVLLDARAPERFRGEREPIDPVAGHIPGARSMPCAANLDDDGCVLGVDALRARFDAVTGGAEDVPLVAYCGSGVTACHLILAAARIGRPLPRLYPGSWSEWCADPARPVARG